MQNDFCTLIENYDSQVLTQSSTVSMRQSQRSEIELKFFANDQDSSHTESEDDTPGAGRPTGSKARLEDVGPRQVRDRTAEIYNDMVQFCKANGQELEQFLTLYRPGGGHYGPNYHESVCPCRKVRATLTKLPDFVPFDVCQVQESQFWCLLFKKLKNIDVKNFWGSSSIR